MQRAIPVFETAKLVEDVSPPLRPAPIEARQFVLATELPTAKPDFAQVAARELDLLRPAQSQGAWASLQRSGPPAVARPGSLASTKANSRAGTSFRLPASLTGLWAANREACLNPSESEYLPMRLSSSQATAGEGACKFLSGTKSGHGWAVVAQCTDGASDWVSDVRLSMGKGELNWSSQRGSETYVRCQPLVTAKSPAHRKVAVKIAARKTHRLSASRPRMQGVRVISGAAVPVSWVFVRAR